MNNMSIPAPQPPIGDRIDAYRAAPAGSAIPEDDAPTFDLRAIWATLYRSRRVVLAILVVAALAGIASVLLMPRIYQARASVQIDQQTAKVLGTEENDPVVSGGDADRFLQTQVDVLSSRSMARRVAESLGLAANDEFLKRMSGEEEIKADPNAGPRIDQVTDTLQRNLTVDLRRNSRVVGVVFTSRDPQLAAQIANSYANNFIEGNIQRKFSTSAYSRKFLDEQLDLAKRRLEESERQLITYARSAQLIDASGGASRQLDQAQGPRSLVTANLVQLNTDYATSEANRLQARQRWEQARAAPLMTLPEVLSNDALQRLTQRRAEQIAQINELSQRLKPDHPTVVQANAQLSALEQQIRVFAESIRQSIRNQYLTAERQHQALERQVASLKGATLAEQDRSVRYNILKREVDTNRQLYESLLQRFKEVSAEAGVTSNNVTVVDVAEAPRRPTSPRPLINLALAAIAGIGLALLYAFGRDYLDDSIRDPQDVEAKLGLPVLGVVPERSDGAPLAALADPRSDVAEAYHSARTAIELSSNQGTPRSILVTGSGKSEGKSTTSYALARDFASLGKRTLIVDGDLRRPSLHRVFNMPQAERGLSSVLARIDTNDSVILKTQVENLSFLPSGLIPPDPATLYAGTAMAELLAVMQREYDIIVVDGPPVLALADATQLAAAAQATVFVVEAGGAHYGQARSAVTRLMRAGANVIGCVVTKYNARKSGYGDAYDYYRYHYEDDRKPA
ncbi:polysaccharide biosynthesis tyrosine autokinase [Sphingomonas sp. Y38-1Y]|uniref:GumC family protein n=1 Tax=Sphingomonas sp. Y38-1Y TaxID=3078265 RepID=UPI0028F01E48|nr:polysaccharide biosynthesis tyrosine autokinase [Sphingomonas sp. Y38-1Y]